MMQDDPNRRQKADRWDQLTQNGMDPSAATQQVEREFAAASSGQGGSSARPVSPRPAAPKAAPTQYIRSALQGALLGTPDEIEAAGRGVVGAVRRAAGLHGETYGEAAEDVRGKLKAFREESPKAAFAAEMAGGMLTGGLAGGTKTVIGRTLMNPAVSGLISGAAGADGDVMNRVKGAVVGGAAGKVIGTVLTPTRTLQRDVVQDVAAAQSPAGSRIVRALSDIRNKAATTMDKSQRFAADQLEKRGFAGAARAIEPVDETTIRRTVNRNLPGTGVSEGALEQEAATLGARATSEAQGVKAIGDEVQAVQVETVNRGKALAERAVEQSKVRAEQLVKDAKAKASALIGGVRQKTGTADELRATLRSTQQEEAEQTYAAVRQFGRPAQEPVAVYDAILKSPGLRGVYRTVVRATREAKVGEKLAATEGGELFTPLSSVRMPRVAIPRPGGKEVKVPALTLETMDEMRRHVNEQISARLSGKETGLSPSMGRKMIQQIDVLENKFLDAYPPEARDVIKAARAAYREKFVALEALQDGVNLGGVRADKAAKLLSSNPKAFSSLAKRVSEQYTTPEAREAFRAGGREWFNNLVTDRLDDALSFAQQVIKTDGGRRRVALVFGKDMVEQMRQIASLADEAGGVVAKGQARAERITGMGEQAAERLGDRLRPQVFAQQDLTSAVQSQAEEAAAKLAAARQALQALSSGGREAAASFVDVTLPQMGTQARGAVQDYGASAIQREIAGLDAPTALERLRQLQGNSAAKALFGSQLDRTIADLEKRTIGSLTRPALAGAAGRRLGGLFTGREE